MGCPMPEPEYEGNKPASYRPRYQVAFAIAVALVLGFCIFVFMFR
jgi:hypothetical protein